MRSDEKLLVTLTGKRDTTQSMIYYDLLSFVVIVVISVYISQLFIVDVSPTYFTQMWNAKDLSKFDDGSRLVP